MNRYSCTGNFPPARTTFSSAAASGHRSDLKFLLLLLFQEIKAIPPIWRAFLFDERFVRFRAAVTTTSGATTTTTPGGGAASGGSTTGSSDSGASSGASSSAGGSSAGGTAAVGGPSGSVAVQTPQGAVTVPTPAPVMVPLAAFDGYLDNCQARLQHHRALFAIPLARLRADIDDFVECADRCRFDSSYRWQFRSHQQLHHGHFRRGLQHDSCKC